VSGLPVPGAVPLERSGALGQEGRALGWAEALSVQVHRVAPELVAVPARPGCVPAGPGRGPAGRGRWALGRARCHVALMQLTVLHQAPAPTVGRPEVARHHVVAGGPAVPVEDQAVVGALPVAVPGAASTAARSWRLRPRPLTCRRALLSPRARS
jgi:hypothetical protein